MVTRTKDNKKTNKILKILALVIILNIMLSINTNKIYASTDTIKVKPGETVRKELKPNLQYYEVLSLNENGEGKESIEQVFETDKYTVKYTLEGVYGDKFVMEITGKEVGKKSQDILYYIYKKEGEPFTKYRSEVLIDVYDENAKENKDQTEPNNENKDSNKDKNKDNKININSSKVNDNINTKLIKINFQNANYVSLADVHFREGNFVGSKSFGTIKEGSILQSTGYTDNGWIRVIYNGKVGFVSGNYLKLQKQGELTKEMEQSKKEEEKEYKEELKKIGIVDSKGRTKEEQLEYLKSTVGTIPNVGNNKQYKVFLLVTAVGIALAVVLNKNKRI